MLKISQRAEKTIASPIRKFLPLAEKAKKKGIKIFHLNIGQPDILPPKSVWQSILAYQKKAGIIPYAPSEGFIEVRSAWQKYYRDWGLKISADNILITTGASEAIVFALLTVADVGDEILIFEPAYSSYKSFAQMTDVKLVPLTLKLENNFSLPTVQEIEKKISKKTKALILINPNNPTGRIYSKKELEVLVKIAKKHGLFIISDETYRESTFNNQRAASLLDFPQIKNQVIIVDSASKRFSSCGSRVGCLISKNQQVITNALKFAQARLSVPTIDQLSLVPILRQSKNYIKKINQEYQRRKEIVYGALKDISQVTVFEPKATFYLIVGLPIKNAEEFVIWLLSKFNYQGKTVMVTPAEDFYITKGRGRNEIRIAYVLNAKELKVAMKILTRGLKEYLNK